MLLKKATALVWMGQAMQEALAVVHSLATVPVVVCAIGVVQATPVQMRQSFASVCARTMLILQRCQLVASAQAAHQKSEMPLVHIEILQSQL